MASREHYRSAARYAIDLPVAIRDTPNAPSIEGRLVDVSLAGARIEALGEWSEGAQVVVEVKTPTLWDPLVIDALVAWSRRMDSTISTEIGVKFMHRSPAALAALFDLLGTQDFESL